MGDFFVNTTKPSDIFVGTTPVQAMYINTSKVWEKSAGDSIIFDGTLREGYTGTGAFLLHYSGGDTPWSGDLTGDKYSTSKSGNAMAQIYVSEITTTCGKYLNEYGVPYADQGTYYITGINFADLRTRYTQIHFQIVALTYDPTVGSTRVGATQIRFSDEASNYMHIDMDMANVSQVENIWVGDISQTLNASFDNKTCIEIGGEIRISKIWLT